MKFKIGDRVKHKFTKQIGTIVCIDRAKANNIPSLTIPIALKLDEPNYTMEKWGGYGKERWMDYPPKYLELAHEDELEVI